MKIFYGILAVISAIAMIISSVITRAWYGIIIVLSILKLLGLVYIPWFGTVFVLSAIGTGLWVLLIGFIAIIINFIITTVSVMKLSDE